MKKSIMMILLIIAGSYGITNAQQPAVIVSDTKGWHKIGETVVNFQKDRDEIILVGANRFASIKFKVEDAPIDLQSLEVYYDSGDRQDIKINATVKAPGTSRVIDLNGGERDVKKIVFVYKTLPNHKDVKAHIEIWGLKTNAESLNINADKM